MTVKLAAHLRTIILDKLVLDSSNDIPNGPADDEVVRACTNSEHTVMVKGRPQFLSVTARKDACAALKAQACLRSSAEGAAFLAAKIAHAVAFVRHYQRTPMSVAEQVSFAHELGGFMFSESRNVCEPEPVVATRTEKPGFFESLSDHIEILANTIIGLETDEEYGPNGELIPKEYR